MSETRETIGVILQKLADELCPDIQAGYLSESVNKIMIILDGKVKAARAGALEDATQRAAAAIQSHFYDLEATTKIPRHEVVCLIDDVVDLIEAEK